MLMLNVKPFRS